MPIVLQLGPLHCREAFMFLLPCQCLACNSIAQLVFSKSWHKSWPVHPDHVCQTMPYTLSNMNKSPNLKSWHITWRCKIAWQKLHHLLSIHKSTLIFPYFVKINSSFEPSLWSDVAKIACWWASEGPAVVIGGVVSSFVSWCAVMCTPARPLPWLKYGGVWGGDGIEMKGYF